jgi:two-component system chemotaxis response regulator CheY
MAVDMNMPILVVDDQSTMLRIERNLLEQLGFKSIDTALDGPTALRKARATRFGLIISDWNMDPMTGLEFLKEVRADPDLKSTPFIMVTAESKTENVVMAKQAGVNNYVVKPFNAATLKKKIAAVIGEF